MRGPRGLKGDTGDSGPAGIGISKIEKTSSLENIDTYTITYTNNTTSTFSITNGEDGEDGKDGEDGSTIYNGNGEPNEALGAIGDCYINNFTGELYKKATDTEWSYIITLKGRDGIDGKDGVRGSQINTLQGSTAPTDATSFILGDLMFVLGTSDLYQVIGSSDAKSWSHIGNLKGSIGNPGRPQRVFLMNSTTSTDPDYIFITSSGNVNNSVAPIATQYKVNNIEYQNLAIGDIAININSSSPYYGCFYSCVNISGTSSTWQQIISEYAKSISMEEETISNSTSINISPNKYYKITTSYAYQTIYLKDSIAGMYNEYMFELTITTTPNSSSLNIYGTDGKAVKWAGGFKPNDLRANTLYQCSIVNNIACIMEVE